MKMLEFYASSSTVSGLKPLMDRLAEELSDEWEYAFDADANTARFTHGVMYFEFSSTISATSSISITCGNGKIKYTSALNNMWGGKTNQYFYIDILEAEDRGTVVLGFRTASESSYGFNVIWGKYDDGSEYLVWGVTNTSSAEIPSTLLDDTATASRPFPNLFENTEAPWCFGKLPKSNHAALPTSLYFGSSVPFRTHYIELLRGDKKFVGFAALKAGSNNAVTSKPSMFAVPVKSFDVEHITI